MCPFINWKIEDIIYVVSQNDETSNGWGVHYRNLRNVLKWVGCESKPMPQERHAKFYSIGMESCFLWPGAKQHWTIVWKPMENPAQEKVCKRKGNKGLVPFNSALEALAINPRELSRKPKTLSKSKAASRFSSERKTKNIKKHLTSGLSSHQQQVPASRILRDFLWFYWAS